MDKNIDSFVSDNYVRLTYIAFFTQWVFWGLIYTLRHILGDIDKTATAASEDPEASANTDKKIWHHAAASESLARRVANIHKSVRDDTLLLLSALVLNTFGNASTRAVMIITWIYFAFTVVFAASELFVVNRFVRLIHATLFYGLGLAIGGLAFARGW
ncbi:hypothetical protein BX666DRAFT_1267581 [Dichotomocladium elegans]|nr:hypothetical protein BX666DRAFT_1267581 [Dichotomocladium elegans]